MLLFLLFLFLFLLLCDQDNRAAPTHQVDDIDEIHVCQVDHKGEHWGVDINRSDVALDCLFVGIVCLFGRYLLFLGRYSWSEATQADSLIGMQNKCKTNAGRAPSQNRPQPCYFWGRRPSWLHKSNTDRATPSPA